MSVLYRLARRLQDLVEESYEPSFVGSSSKMKTLRAAADGLASVVLGLIEDEKNETPQIIRTVEELEALDPDTVILSKKRELDLAGYVTALIGRQYSTPEYQLPVAVIATGEQIRAARAALEEE